MAKWLGIANLEKPELRFFMLLGLLTALAVWGAIALDEPLLAGAPFALLLVYQTVVNYKAVYILLFASIPLSAEIFFSDSLATDLPSEPLIIGLMLVYLLQVFSRPDLINGKFFKHPLSLLIIGHLLWIAFTTILSANMGVSIKFLLAKGWYIITFFFLTGHLMRSEREAWSLWWWIIIPLTFATTKVILHHAILDFGFKEINEATHPFFRNHVSYAAILALMIPLLWFFWGRYKRWTWKWWILAGCMAILFFGMVTAYTRAAYVALFLAFGAYFVIRLRLVRWVLAGATIVIAAAFTYLVNDNQFMEYAPSERTIAHEELGDIVAATYSMEDVSTSERYYRWIAGVRMSAEDPITGFGPGNFYFFYKQYTLNRFSTYVSDNPEKSGIHNYFLMTLVEQGWVGMLLFISMVFYTLILGEKVYHQSKSMNRKALAMGLMLLLIVIDAFLLMNDMIETDKVGSFFFFSMAILVNLDLKNQEEVQNSSYNDTSLNSNK
jgi:O-antigen ligase